MIEELLFKADGPFSLFDYHITHRRLLIRQTNFVDEVPVNTDLYFSSVQYVELDTGIDGLEIYKGKQKSREYVEERIVNKNLFGDCPVYRIVSQGRNYYIAALGFEVQENGLPPTTSSLSDPYSSVK